MKTAMLMLAASVVAVSGDCVTAKMANGQPWTFHHNNEDFSCDWFAHIGNCATFGDVFEVDGVSANDACCECAGGADGHATLAPAPTQPAKECVTKKFVNGKHWEVDVKGVMVNCEWFAFENRCDHSGHKFSGEDMTPNVACCECGGGVMENPGTTETLCPNGVREAGMEVKHFDYANDETVCWRADCAGTVHLNIAESATELQHDFLSFYTLDAEKGWVQSGEAMSGAFSTDAALVFPADVLIVFNSDHSLNAGEGGFSFNWACKHERRVSVTTGEMGSAGAIGKYEVWMDHYIWEATTLEYIQQSECLLGHVVNPRAGQSHHFVMYSADEGEPGTTTRGDGSVVPVKCNLDWVHREETELDGVVEIYFYPTEGSSADSWYVASVEVESEKASGVFYKWGAASDMDHPKHHTEGMWVKGMEQTPSAIPFWTFSVFSLPCKEAPIDETVVITQNTYENDVHTCFVTTDKCESPIVSLMTTTTEAKHDRLTVHYFDFDQGTWTSQEHYHAGNQPADGMTWSAKHVDDRFTIRFDSDDGVVEGGFGFTVTCN